MVERHSEAVTRRVTYRDPVVPEDAVEHVDQSALTTDVATPHRAAFVVSRAVYLVFGVIEALLLIRFVLKALGASERAGFTSFIYGLTEPLLAPFAGMFGTPTSSAGSVLEIHTLVAILVYALLAWLVSALLSLTVSGRRTAL